MRGGVRMKPLRAGQTLSIGTLGPRAIQIHAQ
jgi:hypothetical protein